MKVSENKTHSLHLRLTDAQYEFCRDNAELMGVGISDFVRMTINTLAVTSDRISQKVNRRVEMSLGDLEHENAKNNIEHII